MKSMITGLLISTAIISSLYAESKVKSRHNFAQEKNHHESHNKTHIYSSRTYSSRQHHESHNNSHHDRHKSSHHDRHRDTHITTTHKSYSTYGSSHSNSSGYYDYVTKKIWIPERCEKIWVPARYEYRRNHCGDFVRVQTCAGHYDKRVTAGFYDYQTVKVWRSKPHCNTSRSVSIHWGW